MLLRLTTKSSATKIRGALSYEKEKEEETYFSVRENTKTKKTSQRLGENICEII